ncbi:MAG: putative permease [Candidatus Endobugula sp.]|jgi:predicted permease
MAIVLSILPIFFIILVGAFFRRMAFPDHGFWSGAEKITYYVFFPALLISKMAAAEMGSINVLSIAPLLVSILLLMTGLMVLAHWVSRKQKVLTDPAFTSVFQGGIRFNTYVGLAIVAALYGSEGVVIALVMVAIMIPLVNILCVTILELYAEKVSSQRLRRLLMSIVSNPLIIGCVVGVVINVSNIALPYVLSEILTIFSQVALPLGLLTVGAALSLRAFNGVALPLFLSCLVKFLLLPILAVVLAAVFGVSGIEYKVLLILAVLPTATSAYVLAKQLGGDAELMATIITVQTLLSAVWIPLVLGITKTV